MKLLVTGSAGLIGSEAVRSFDASGHVVVGIDNNMRQTFFGPAGDTTWCREQLLATTKSYRHVDIDIRDRDRILELFRTENFDAVIHCAAQPSHDRARDFPFIDFDVNAVGTLNLLEANRLYSADSPFVHMSTNKVYGDAPNEISMRELESRWDYADDAYAEGISENCRVDQSTHSVFGASKAAADLMVQEYGRYFGMPTCCLRGGCLTGPSHAGVELHGFVSYLIRCNVTESPYTVFGYRAKQVRDNIHSEDVIDFMSRFIEAPRSAAVYNIGGGRGNSISILEAFALIESITGKPMQWSYAEQNRIGDHICYYSDLRRMQHDYPGWGITRDLRSTFQEISDAWERRVAVSALTADQAIRV